ncbi:hypothetical protein [Polaromonas sp. JS666]|uniref:hypothetical protein n=1 Tax=Polaromonas sp. (strain JS666 / ATCC BAA-500) TaxID=296591 RepID=UPI0012ECD110|nr:hypothetical protein [Polaromonas sp. JS666]
MARYKLVDRSPKFIPVVLDAQIQPGSFEYALDHLVDHELDLSCLHARYPCSQNQETVPVESRRSCTCVVGIRFLYSLVSQVSLPGGDGRHRGEHAPLKVDFSGRIWQCRLALF